MAKLYKKDFEAIAHAIKLARMDNKSNPMAQKGITDVATELKMLLQSTNSEYNHERFMTQCSLDK